MIYILINIQIYIVREESGSKNGGMIFQNI